MAPHKIEPAKTKELRPPHRCERFAAGAAETIGAARNCLFSLLPYEERFRKAESWYEACSQAMLRGNYAPLDEWIRREACLAEAENFGLEDLLQLLRICRLSAINIDRWEEDVFSTVDEVINEGLRAIREKVAWKISPDLNYLNASEAKAALRPQPGDSKTFAPGETRDGERRESGRNRLALPIRIRRTTEKGPGEEITYTQNVSLSGLYFKTQEKYRVGSDLQIVYPYWTGPGSINRQYAARVARLDPMPNRFWGVAVEFLQDLRDKAH